jgi:hypothetical protein
MKIKFTAKHAIPKLRERSRKVYLFHADLKRLKQIVQIQEDNLKLNLLKSVESA